MSQPIPAGARLAGPVSRLLGLFIDNILLNLLTLPFMLPGVLMIIKGVENCPTTESDDGFTVTCTESEIQAGWLLGGIVCVGIAVVIILFLYCRWLGKGRTPGMRITGNRLVDVNSGQPIGTGRAFGRVLFAAIISPAICLLGYLWALWDSRKQTWHDKIVSSIVIKN
jgi:uncharacterized RDD family membrane protein YckC